MAATTAIRSIPIEDLYSRWGGDYDQGQVNNMQGLDDVQLATLLPRFLSLVQAAHASGPDFKLIDFGCGTGRNTLKLLAVPSATVIGLDATPRLLDIARQRCRQRLASLPEHARAADVQCHVYNPLVHAAPPAGASGASGLISTLVLEHLTLPDFLAATSALLKPGAFLLATNTHPELARVGRGSVPDKETGELLWGASHVHSAEDVEREAPKWGMELVGVQEGSPVDPKMVGAMRGDWEGVKCWIGFLLRKKEE